MYKFLHSGFEDWCKRQVKTESKHRVNDTDNQPIGRHVVWGLTSRCLASLELFC